MRCRAVRTFGRREVMAAAAAALLGPAAMAQSAGDADGDEVEAYARRYVERRYSYSPAAGSYVYSARRPDEPQEVASAQVTETALAGQDLVRVRFRVIRVRLSAGGAEQATEWYDGLAEMDRANRASEDNPLGLRVLRFVAERADPPAGQ
jgi:hypothetical protein